MLIIGAKGFAKEVLECLGKKERSQALQFYDDINLDGPKNLYGIYPILKSFEEAKEYFINIDNRFTIGLGNSSLRKKTYKKFIELNGKFVSTISNKANIAPHVSIGDGANILPGATISNDVTIGVGALIYYNVIITHDVTIGDFVELSPSCNILGRVKIGNQVNIGANATILPDISIGDNAVIGAGAVVTKDVGVNETVVGIPARKI